MKSLFRPRLVAAIAYIGLFFVAGMSASESERVVVVVNANDPASLRIGEYYAQARGIPRENIIRLNTSEKETIKLEEYVETISNPLLDNLIEKGWVDGLQASDLDTYGRKRMALVSHSVRYLVTIRGIPLRIENEPDAISEAEYALPKQFMVTHGSVDSELSLLLGPPNVSMAAFVPNPAFEKASLSSLDTRRLLTVSRLDGPSETDVTRLIDRTLQAEKEGLMGRAYFDLGGPHKTGDKWLKDASVLAESAYFDTQVESRKRELGFTDRLDAPAIYMGWYQKKAYGPWLMPRWSVPPGAIGFHLHSFSAKTVRSKKSGWVGPLVHQGYCATVGNVYEPYLEFTHRFQLILQYLLEGHSFGDAAMWSHPALSWQGVVLGDPLYRPFAQGLESQITSGEGGVFRSYATIREGNRLEATAGVDAAINYLRVEFVKSPSLPLSLALGQKYIDSGEIKKGIEALKLIGYLNQFSPDERMVAKQVADLLSANGESYSAYSIYEKLIDTRDLKPELLSVLLDDGVTIASKAGEHSAVSGWSLMQRELEEKPK